MRRVLAVLLAATTLLCFCASDDSPANPSTLHTDLGPVPPFSLTERSGRTITREDLLGKVWIASFFFSQCAGGCGRINETMAQLQRDLAGYPDVVLVSFSVKPESDTPQALTEYANRFGADPDRWLFLTGNEKDMYELIEKGFYQSVARVPNAKPGFEVDHTFRLMVVDHRGRIRGYISDARSEEELPELRQRVRQLVLPLYFPPLNASLNATSGVLLMIGYLAVRRRWITFHKACMLMALAVSTIFLGCYLYYHIVVLDGEPTRFRGAGLIRWVYFAILLSHTFLAAIAAPLALYTAFQGLRGNLTRHVKIARWALPIWLYVSITGVVVYWMLYRLYPPGG